MFLSFKLFIMWETGNDYKNSDLLHKDIVKND